MSEQLLRQFEAVLDQENPDLYKWLTGQESPPAAMAENAAYQVSHLRLPCCQLALHVAKLLQNTLSAACQQCIVAQVCDWAVLAALYGCIVLKSICRMVTRLVYIRVALPMPAVSDGPLHTIHGLFLQVSQMTF